MVVDALHNILSKVRDGDTISEAEALQLFESNDLIEIGYVAAQLNIKKNQHSVAINEHRFIRTTFEGYYAPFFNALRAETDPASKERDSEQYLEQLTTRITKVVSRATTELRLCSLNPAVISFDFLQKIISRMRGTFADLSLRALSASEVIRYAAAEECSTLDILKGLATAGLRHLDGRGGTPFFPFIKPAVPIDPHDWFAIHEEAHSVGIKSDATMAYGHGETFFDRLQFLKRLRELQDKSHGFLSFTALPLHIHGERLSETLGLDDLKTIAIARIYLDNFDNISTSWGRLGLDVTQLALNFGVNDLDGSLSDDSNKRVAGARPFRAISHERLDMIVRKAQYIPHNIKCPLTIAVQDSPTFLTRDENLITRLLYQTEHGKDLSVEEAVTLIRDASLLEIGYLASLIKAQLVNTSKVGVLTRAYEVPLELLLTPEKAIEHLQERLVSRFGYQRGDYFAVHLNLGKWDENLTQLQLHHVEVFFNQLYALNNDLQFVIKGLKGLWRFSRSENKPLIRILQSLKDAHVTAIESSGSDAEDDFTTTEVVNTHRAVHELDISSAGKIELAAPPRGFDPPFWEAFIRRLEAMRTLQDKTHGLLAIKVEPAPRAVISPYEYLKALAITRIFVRNIPNIIAPFLKIPSLEEKNGKPSPTSFKSCLKFMPVCVQFGANDIGFIKHEQQQVNQICQELKQSGFIHYQRNMRFYHI